MRLLRFEGKQALEDRLQYITDHAKSKLGKALETAAVIVETEAKKQVGAGRPAHTRVGGGQLRASLTHYLDATQFRAYIGSALKYSPVHEYGATIKAKNKPYLWFFIPSEWARAQTKERIDKVTGKPRKVNRWTPRQIRNQGMGYWVRVKQVTIPARPYLGPALDAKRGAVKAEIETALGSLLEGH